ncbi:DUF6777 domain-containing protein [Streptomyces sp. NPDC023838]|uniref:DUF6777 domain-containing protein n=1 Tax=Streptomyces sp. NPDC023838 TaxID=3154325 RepID=UPI0033DF34B5
MRPTPRRFTLAAVVMSIGVFVAACGGDNNGTSASDQKELFLQPVAESGPDPFTESTAKAAKPLTPSQPPPSAPSSPTASVQTVRSVSGSTPGLYGGTQSVASCDVEQQIRFLNADRVKARAFSETAGINPDDLPSFLRGLTPVVLRADTRVTNHGFKDGHATAFQSVLQAGTAVMVDDHGTPRVRCACGNPLQPPVATQGAASRGQSWPGYQPQRTVVINRTTTVINSLIIVNVINNTWIERPAGDPGMRDRERPDIQIDPTAPVVTDSPSTPVSPDGSSPAVSPSESTPSTSTTAPSTLCPSPAPTVTVTQSPLSAPPGGTAPSAPTVSGCPTATITVSPKRTSKPPSIPVTPSQQLVPPTPSTALPTLPSEPPTVFPPSAGGGGMPSSGGEMPSGGGEMLSGGGEMPSGGGEMLSGGGEMPSGGAEMPLAIPDFDTEPPLDARLP